MATASKPGVKMCVICEKKPALSGETCGRSCRAKLRHLRAGHKLSVIRRCGYCGQPVPRPPDHAERWKSAYCCHAHKMLAECEVVVDKTCAFCGKPVTKTGFRAKFNRAFCNQECWTMFRKRGKLNRMAQKMLSKSSVRQRRTSAIRAKLATMELKPRELNVITLRYGLNDGRFRTLAEVAAELSCTRENVRLIERAALNQLFPDQKRSEAHATALSSS